MSTVIEQRILLFPITDLTQIHLFVCNFPIADSLTVALTILVATDVLVTCFALHERALSVTLVLEPVTVVGIAVWIFHYALALAEARNEVTLINGGEVGDVFAAAMVQAIFKSATVVGAGEGGFDCFEAGEGLDWMATGYAP